MEFFIKLQTDTLCDAVDPGFFVRYLPSHDEWSVASIREMFDFSPEFPRLRDPDMAIRKSISRGVEQGDFAAAGKTADGCYEPFYYRSHLQIDECTNDMFLISSTVAEKIRERRRRAWLFQS